MRDAFGGIVNIVIIVVFLTLVSGYLAFNVNYTKAFRVKNKIISTFEQYEGCENANSTCDSIIQEYMKELGYSAPNFNLSSDGDTCRYGYCYKNVESDSGEVESSKNRAYYKIVTQITIDLPIINRVMQGMDAFKIKGDTKTFVINN